MNQLQHLYEQLARLRAWRQWFARLTGGSAIGIALLAALLILFGLDWLFRRSEDLTQRIFLLALGLVAILWATRRFALPWFGRKEDPVELALKVQDQAGIDSDLVAAMQFESQSNPHWGSSQLQSVVVEQVAFRARGLDVMAVLSREPLVTRLKVLAALVGVWVVLSILYPGHVAVFFNRLFLGSQHYPTTTQFVSFTVNGKKVDLSSTENLQVFLPYGRPAVFEVQATPASTTDGRVELTSVDGGKSAKIALDPVVNADDETIARFKGQHARLIQSAICQVYAGDAFSEPVRLEIIPAPNLQIEPEVVRPAYARGTAEEVQQLRRGISQFSVVEGSEVRLKVHSDRPLKSMRFSRRDHAPELEMRKVGGVEGDEVWTLDAKGSPLAAVTSPVQFAIQATDTTDETLEHPIEGLIRIEPDLSPRVVAATKTRVIVPDAAPSLHYGVSDDHAVQRIWLSCDVIRGEESVGEERVTKEVEVYRLAEKVEPEATLEGAHVLDLKPFRLHRGDSLKVIVHARDYRGGQEGKASASEAIVFQVTDEQGVLAALQEGDQKSARQLEGIIKNLLRLGESP